MLARYDLEHELGAGASGAVFRGRDRGTGRVVAVKLVSALHASLCGAGTVPAP